MFEFGIVTLFLYFVPTIVVVARRSHNMGPVAVVNLFAGWTGVGWVIALAMAVTKNKNVL